MTAPEELKTQTERNDAALRETGKQMAADFDARILRWLQGK